MQNWSVKLREFNQSMNDLPRKALYVVAVLALAFLVGWSIPYLFPFYLAAIFAWMMEPMVRLLTKLLGNFKISRKIASGLSVVLLFGIVLSITIILFTKLIVEAEALIQNLPAWASYAVTEISAWLNGLDISWELISPEAIGFINDALSNLGRQAVSYASQMTSSLATFILNFSMSVPEIVLAIVLTLMGTFYMAGDRETIFAFLRTQLPEKLRSKGNTVKASLFKAVFGQLRAALIMLLITSIELIICFHVIGIDYALLLAIFVALADALPVIGAGLFLIPLSVYGFFIGDIWMGFGLAATYLITIIVRQILEPRIVGKQLGLHPLATMIAMFIGLKSIGFIGMLLGPMLMLIIRAVLSEVDSQKSALALEADKAPVAAIGAPKGQAKPSGAKRRWQRKKK